MEFSTLKKKSAPGGLTVMTVILSAEACHFATAITPRTTCC